MALVHSTFGRSTVGGRILIPSFTFAAGAEAILWCGFEPMFLDIEEGSLQPSLDDAETAVGEDDTIVGVLLCNTFGIGNPRIVEWEAFAARHGLPLLIDSAAGFGSDYPLAGRVGSAGSAEVFSFHATKPFAIGEGGAVVTRDGALAARLHSFQNFGFEASSGAVALGLNAKLQEINAAIGLRQLAGFDRAIASRRAAVEIYRGALEPLGFSFPEGIQDSSVCFASVLVDDARRRPALLASLASNGVEARTYYSPPLHRQPALASSPRVGDLAVTASVVDRIISLPVHQDMDPDHIATVIASMIDQGRP